MKRRRAAARICLPVLGLLSGLLWANSVQAWGQQGHQIVALMAQQNLSASAKAKVAALLALEPGADLASISSWADEQRAPATAAWHYVNMPPDDCRYSPVRDCPNDNCVVAAIQQQTHIYRFGASAQEQLTALKYLVHFVADVHQPLHAGYAHDRGGNRYQLQAFGRGTNLHALWDVGLVNALWPHGANLPTELNSAAAATADAADAFAPALWAGESCEIVRRADFYPPRKLPDTYLSDYGPLVKQRLRQAARRLAAILNSD